MLPRVLCVQVTTAQAGVLGSHPKVIAGPPMLPASRPRAAVTLVTALASSCGVRGPVPSPLLSCRPGPQTAPWLALVHHRMGGARRPPKPARPSPHTTWGGGVVATVPAATSAARSGTQVSLACRGPVLTAHRRRPEDSLQEVEWGLAKSMCIFLKRANTCVQFSALHGHFLPRSSKYKT